MKHSTTTKAFVRQLVINYKQYSNLDGFWTISTDHIPDFNLHELSSLIIKENDSWAIEATGPDNPAYISMVGALTKYLANSTNRESQIEFDRIWRDGVTNYLMPVIEEMLEEHIQEYNSYRNYVSKNRPVYTEGARTC